MTIPDKTHLNLDQALDALKTDFVERNPASARQFAQQTRDMPGGNSRSVLFYAPFPLTMASGRGAELTDLDGHTYSDFIAEYTAGVYGHSAPEIREAVLAAMDNGINLTGHNLYEGKLARLLCERFPQVEQVRFTNSGTEANLMAITAALHFTGRRRIVVFTGGYHGGVLGFGTTAAPTTVPFDFLVLPYNDIERARAEAQQNGRPHDFLDKVAYGSDWHMPSMVDNTARYLDVFVDIMNRPAYAAHRDPFFHDTAMAYLKR